MWPDEKLEAEMLRDVAIVEEHYVGTASRDVCCHVRALLQRVRQLEAISDKQHEACKQAYSLIGPQIAGRPLEVSVALYKVIAKDRSFKGGSDANPK